MQQLYRQGGYLPLDLEPVVIGLPCEVYNIFDVPEANAVGTIDIDNAFAIVKFRNDAVDFRFVRKDYLEEVSGDYVFCFTPRYSDEEVAYSQTRGFTLINIKTGAVGLYDICASLNDHIGGLAVLNATSRTYIFEILRPAEYPHEMDYERHFQCIRISGDIPVISAEIPAGIRPGIGEGDPWVVHNGKVLVYDDSSTTFKCFDGKMAGVHHPIEEIFNRSRIGFRSLAEIDVHPTLPFALLLEVSTPDSFDDFRHALWLLRWDTSDEKKQFLPIVTDTVSAIGIEKGTHFGNLFISPDGRWLVYARNNEDYRSPEFFAVSIDPANPLFLGKHYRLGRVLRPLDEGDHLGPSAWATEPTSFVVSDGKILYKWELDKLPH